MKTQIVTLLALITLGVQAAFACGCDINCPEGEQYSDEHEMCMPVTDAVS